MPGKIYGRIGLVANIYAYEGIYDAEEKAEKSEAVDAKKTLSIPLPVES